MDSARAGEMMDDFLFTPHYTPAPQDSKRIFVIHFIFFQRLPWRMVSHHLLFSNVNLSVA